MRAGADWLAAELEWHLKAMDVDVTGGPPLTAVVETLRERSKTLAEMAQGCVFFFTIRPGDQEKAASKFLTAESRPALVDLRHRLGTVGEWSAAAIHGVLQRLARNGAWVWKIAQPLRVAVSGGSVSAD